MEVSMQVLDSGVEIRRGEHRGTFSNHWLFARFSFSFGDWWHPGRQAFGPLRALNEDIVQPGSGFEMHGHRDLDIFMLPLAGKVEHRDNLGDRALVQPGQVQRMFAGSGIRHSQMNASATEIDHHLQIWLQPRRVGGTPMVESRDFDLFGRLGHWCFVVAPDGRDNSFEFDGDVFLATTRVDEHRAATWHARRDSMVYLHMVDGDGVVLLGTDGTEIRLGTGDALAIHRAGSMPVQVKSKGRPARFLIFEFGVTDPA